ncbi:protein-L-isoaspartate(D-aspartate) O-methyltransferase [bacterium]|nr:protein-L-isoaspartate(D-aspartate) O-methyltransferase [bacterium]
MKEYEAKLIDMLQNQITARGVTTPAILEAMQRAPRHLFVPEEFRHAAYEDHPINLPAERSTISQPYMAAYMTEALHCQPHHRVLEIGAGSGYQAALLSYLCAQVYTVERYENLVENAICSIQRIERNNINFKVGDGLLGWPEHAPFDRIIVTAAARKPPRALAEQLTMGGFMLIPLGDSQIQTLTRIERTEDGYKAESLTPCVFVPLVSSEGNLTEIENHDGIEIAD